MLCLAVALPISIWGSINYFYLKNDGITFHPLTLAERKYSWNDIKEVRIRCKRNQKNLELSYAIKMADGTKIDLWQESRLQFIVSYQQLQPFLESSRIERDYEVTPEGLKMLESVYPPSTVADIKHILRV